MMMIPDIIPIKIGEYFTFRLLLNNNLQGTVMFLAYWTQNGEKICRIIKHNNINLIGHLFTNTLHKVKSYEEVKLSDKELKYWRQYVKLCDL